MAPSYDCAASILLCAEDNNSILGFVDGDQENHEMGSLGEIDCLGPSWILGKSRGLHGNFFMDFPLQSEECIAHDLQRELDHMPMGDYAERLLKGELDASIRRDAIDWIWKVHAYFNFGPLSAYLSVNYLDRFLSVYEIPEGNAWMTQLLSVACLSLASKMEETLVPLLLDLQQVGEAKFLFEARTVQRMELLVLSTLKFRMQAVTPFSFVDYFLHKFSDGSGPKKFLILQSAYLILTMIKGIDFLEFKPSELAAAAALTVLEEFQSIENENAFATCVYLEKERVLNCYEMIQNKVRMRLSATKISDSLVSFVPDSPIAVLEAPCLSHTTEETSVFSDPNGDSRSPISKRRRVSR
ncbi:Cyclin-D3-1 [Rhynchospora pubera]|uniref:Cyclin-D3-1 n=1 Tax=Rhynchospora pubera TaxID=906938 RepID=A0AAV8FRZ0_9POAL|nr:Cyclin-D3-1 [Rhynchospora pubera]